VYYDAGGQGWGGQLQIGSDRHETHGSWEPHEEHALTSSTWRELNALLRLLRAFEKFLSHCTAIARGDAQNVFWILSKGGSPKEHLQAVCLKIFWLCVERHIDLRSEWIPRTENQLADYLSKICNSDDFGLSTDAFAFIASRFGTCSVDRFASQHNAKFLRFAFYWCPLAEACNAFTQDWGVSERSYCFPPPHLVARTLQHARACRAHITLVVLGWRTAPWWPLLCGSVESGRGFAPFVRRQLFFPQSRKVLVPGLASREFCGFGVPRCDVFSLDVDFSSSE
jgi:hypothetical protein